MTAAPTTRPPSQVRAHGGDAVSFGLISALYSAGLLAGALAGGVLTRRWPRGRTAAGCVLVSAGAASPAGAAYAGAAAFAAMAVVFFLRRALPDAAEPT